MTWYLTLHPPTDRPAAIDTDQVVDFLASQPELHQTGPIGFESIPGQPWLHVALAESASGGGYASDGSFVPRIDVIELLCSDDGPRRWYDDMAVRIAQFLGWEAVEEHEDRLLWSPQPN